MDVRFGCKRCTSYNVREKGNLLICTSCGYTVERNVESIEERDARILFLSRLDSAEKCLSISPPRFDDAEDMYTEFIRQYPTNSDGYWGRLRAKYGIKLEDDVSGQKIPSCYKCRYEDFTEDSDYKKALQLAESTKLREKYEATANTIAAVYKEWRKEAQKYDYDIFISFKKTDDETNLETQDTREAQSLYTYLLEEGYKVFFSPLSMRRYAGKKAEPYIFNALQKSKVLIVYGSRPEYFSATWVKNEWTRYLRLMRQGQKKNDSCIVVYDNVNPYDLPRELRSTQMLDGSKENRSFYIDLTKKIHELLHEKADNEVSQESTEIEKLRQKLKKLEQGTHSSQLSQSENYSKAKKSATEDTENRKLEEIKRQTEEKKQFAEKSAESLRKQALEEKKKKEEAEELYQKAVKLSNSQKYEEAAELFLKSAQLGKADAQNEIGECYYYGRGVEKNNNIAFNWFSKAAEQGCAMAQFNLGLCYEYGKGVPLNYEGAEKRYSLALQSGNEESKTAIIRIQKKIFQTKNKEAADPLFLYALRLEEENNPKKAAEELLKAAKLGHAAAQFKIGCCYENGIGVKKSIEEAVKWYTEASILEHAQALYALGLCYEFGNGVPQSYDKAQHFYFEAQRNGLLGIEFAIRRVIRSDHFDSTEWRILSDNTLSEKIVRLDEQLASENYKDLLEKADRGDVNAQFHLGECYYWGNGGADRNLELAMMWYTKAAVQGDKDALRELGFAYEFGIDIPRDYEKALEMYTLAADKGSKFSKKSIKRIQRKIKYLQKGYNHAKNKKIVL